MADQSGQPSSASVAPPLVGRGQERATLREALDAALAGRGSLVLIGGEAGVGKTALAEALCGEAREQGAHVLVGRCYDLAETPPYGPWVEALARAQRDEASPVVPHFGGGGATSQAAFFAAVRGYLSGLAASRPLVLLLDDLHWADPASLDLLRSLARSLDDLPLLLLVTYRDDEVAAGHPLAARLPLLVREARAARLDLRPLDAAAIAALVAARYPLDDAAHARLVGYLARRTEGNALFLGELLRTLEGEGLLRRAGDRWVVGDLDGAPVPALLRQVIAGRVARLDPETRRLLTVAAVVGQAVPLALWAAVAGVAEDTLLDAVDAATPAHLVAVAPDGATIGFAHALIREALYEGLVATRRRRVHLRVGEALAVAADPDPDAVAYHFQRAGDPRAVDWLVRAAERAALAYAWLTAAERYEAALALTESGEAVADADLQIVLLYRLARLRRWSDPLGGIVLLERVERLARAAGDDYLAAWAACDRGLARAKAGAARRGLAEMAEALDALDALPPARRVVTIAPGGDPTTLAAVRGETTDPEHHLRGTLALWLANTGRYAEAEAVGRWLGDTPPDPALVRERGEGHADWAVAQAFAHAMLGRPDAARRWYAPMRALYRVLGHHLMDGHAALDELAYTALPYYPDDRAGLAALAADGEAAYARASGMLLGVPPRLARLPLLALEGRWAEARDVVRELSASMPGVAPLAHATLASVAREQGDRDVAWRLVRAALPGGPAAAPGEILHVTALRFQRVAALLALDAGDLPLARDWLAAYDRWLAWSGAVQGRAEGSLGWAAYHRAAGDLAAARADAERALAHAGDPRQPLALLAARRLLGELDTAAGRHAAAATHLDAALALADACGAPYERALTLMSLAELHAAAGRASAATAPLAAARATAEALGAAPALARADALAVRLAPTPTRAALPFGLTTREAEVLALVARGLANGAIADHLALSRRTIEQHLRNAYDKLGVDNRAAATRLAVERGLTRDAPPA